MVMALLEAGAAIDLKDNVRVKAVKISASFYFSRGLCDNISENGNETRIPWKTMCPTIFVHPFLLLSIFNELCIEFKLFEIFDTEVNRTKRKLPRKK